MSIIGNILWIVLGGGIFIFLEYLLSGIILCCTIIGIPFGIQLIKLSLLGLLPFGKEVRTKKSYSGVFNVILNILWALTFGLVIAITHAVFGLIMFVTIIGIPFGFQHFKLASLSFTPFGKEAVYIND